MDELQLLARVSGGDPCPLSKDKRWYLWKKRYCRTTDLTVAHL